MKLQTCNLSVGVSFKKKWVKNLSNLQNFPADTVIVFG